ncbi:hypothetical protein [Streptomyces cyaneofuscatus]|uniref:hypothetical protein n=1 Tax=Streptomyces cyaneofuscatus TaxID=66883 RepID=UPI00344A80C4
MRRGDGSATAGAPAKAMPLSTALGVVALLPLAAALVAFSPSRRTGSGTLRSG